MKKQTESISRCRRLLIDIYMLLGKIQVEGINDPTIFTATMLIHKKLFELDGILESLEAEKENGKGKEVKEHDTK
jgi:hypothetical protein